MPTSRQTNEQEDCRDPQVISVYLCLIRCLQRQQQESEVSLRFFMKGKKWKFSPIEKGERRNLMSLKSVKHGLKEVGDSFLGKGKDR